jgi:hypothetical protein
MTNDQTNLRGLLRSMKLLSLSRDGQVLVVALGTY